LMGVGPLIPLVFLVSSGSAGAGVTLGGRGEGSGRGQGLLPRLLCLIAPIAGVVTVWLAS